VDRKTIRQRVESLLQDQDNRHWSDDDLNGYIDDAQSEFVRICKQPTTTATVALGVAASSSGTVSSAGGKTASVTLASHGYSTGDAINVTGATPTSYNGTFIITRIDDNTFTYILEETGAAVTSSSVSLIKFGPSFTKPTTISEITSVSLNGTELEILTEQEIDSIAHRGSTARYMIRGEHGLVLNPFSRTQSYERLTPKWREITGQPQAVIISHRTAQNFRLYPLPEETKYFYVDINATSKVFQNFTVRGVKRITAMSSDSATPDIDEEWHESLVFGAAQRAYLKETNLRDVSKSDLYLNKFNAILNEARLSEGTNASSYGGGRNETSFRIMR
tara:strand:+ start:135 stop:1136 length:1002 start_codon:yes stop_codon:yes gene_type:complete